MLHPVLASVFEAFEQARVRWCLLRNPTPANAPEGDIDLLVDAADLVHVRRILQAQAFVQVPRVSQSLHFLLYHRPTDRWLWLHIVAEISFGPFYALQTHAQSACLARRQPNGPMMVLAPDDEFWTLLLHCVLDKPTVAAHHRIRLKELISQARTGGSIGRVVEVVCPAGWTPARIITCIQHDDWDALQLLGAALLASWKQKRAIRFGPMLVRRKLRELASLVTWHRRRGVSVALLGPDGAGKSSLALGLQNSFIFPVRSVYMGLTGGRLPQTERLRVPVLIEIGRLSIFWMRYLTALYHQAHGRMVVFDRYIYDAFVRPREQLGWFKRTARWLEGHACPGPDLVLVLNAPADVMFGRKHSYTPAQLEAWRQDFLALQQRVSRLEVLDTNRNIDVVRADVTERIWQRYVSRWSRVCS